jgi:hypothetical protein
LKTIIFSLLALSLLLPNLAFAEPGTSKVTVNDSTFDVNYDATGLAVTGIEADIPSSTITVFVTTSDVSGTLAITLDRSFFDSKSDGTDDDFLVLADGVETTFQESSGDTSRTLTISVPEGASSVDIIALGSTSFGSAQSAPTEQPPVEAAPPAEVPAETTPPAEAPTSELTCGPGTVLQDGACVVQAEPEETATPPAEAPTSELTCGPGTILKDGACMLDETCGPGTILKEGTCVLDQSQAPQAPTESRGLGFDLVAPIVASFVIAFVIMGILWAIGRAGRNKT